MNYIDFLRNKMAVSHETGFDVSPEELTAISARERHRAVLCDEET